VKGKLSEVGFVHCIVYFWPCFESVLKFLVIGETRWAAFTLKFHFPRFV